MAYLPSHRLQIYRGFKALDTQDHYGIVRFYERNENGINTLYFEEYFDCTLCYTEALFQTAEFGKHIVMCDYLLQVILNEDVEAWGGDALYRRVLLRKAQSLFHNREYQRSEHILRELIKINPFDKVARRFLQSCLLSQKPGWLTHTRASMLVMVFLAALTVAAEMFVIRPFYTDYYQTALWVHNSLLGLGLFIMLFGEGLHWFRCLNMTHSFCNKMVLRKTNRT
ncbi:MAG: hypothetical protein IPL65_09115 [Lewinellaceae bacterium]|nr:hypothetical protein [Lewinellaceae bacterium]